MLANNFENEFLATFAATSSKSRGRQYQEDLHPYRTAFQRDRERIIHSKAFRRLEYKTQVFINREGDHYRTRLTHTIEVAQIARTIARALRVNEDLAESIALAHDLGHTPFGHAGERQLNLLLAEHGGFEHNIQSLRVVDTLEKNYTDFNGLNLTWETREGIIKHSSKMPAQYFDEFLPHKMPSLEAQIIDMADEIAYNNHDIDDGISSGIIDINEASELEIWKLARTRCKTLPSEKKLLTRIIARNIINITVTDLIACTLGMLKTTGIETYEDIRNAEKRMVCISADLERANTEVKSFLGKKLYRDYRVSRMSIKAEKVIKDLFTIYTRHPETLPNHLYGREIEGSTITAITDYIAGMTDIFALEEHKKLTDPEVSAL
ncbi:MAG: deoxyguanosinetriphosphate triphosphohydrolase [Leptospirales bacterium]|nr:deoxyguanosinetriphosphate triphosphohydrolase [Leptospirales bacterium]